MTGTHQWFLHVDLDAFFASVEQLDHPEYRGKPLIVGGLPEDRRSVVSTASYEARKFGVHSAMPVFQAYKLCPQGIFVRGRMKRYSELSYKIMNIFKDFSPDVIQMSIDEAFIDLTGTEKLFGPPEETALKIKAKVKQETGLTVSIGLATTKYLAKIASAMSKPDGFFFIHAGDEQNFMQNLPLKKVWGIGTKTLDALNRAGIKTTRDIYEKSLDILQFMYGKSQGQFLYNVVRGLEKETFDQKTKSHSISAEKTFAYDLTDIYTIETNILEICHGVMFRLLKENGFSKTVMLKIRYEDFSTVTVQHTQEKNILTVDSFYAAAKNLFEQKFEKGRGVRLIGVAFENITNDEKPFQQELFDDGSEKKQKVEKAILGLQKKHPEISVHKARLLNNPSQKLKTLIPLIFILGTAFFPQKNYAQSIEKEAEKNVNNKVLTPLFNFDLKNHNFMEVLSSGFWKTEFLFSANTNFGFGNPFTFSVPVPVFKQQLDLSLYFKINKNWYLDFEFLDDYLKNTYTTGYNGEKNLERFQFSNRNISFPDFYSAKELGFSLSSGQIQSPGVILNFTDYKNQRWKSTFLFRYDMTQTKSATFYGYNSIQDRKISLENYVHTKKFALPLEQSIRSVKNIYIENKNGQYKDLMNRSYEQLPQNAYLLLPEQNLIIISDSYKKKLNSQTVSSVLITFYTNENFSECINSLGSWSEPDSFLGKIQTYFNQNSVETINVQNYSYDFYNQINGDSAIEIQSPNGFSPFIAADTYDCGITDSADVEVCYSSGLPAKNIFAYIDESNLLFMQQDYFLENHTYAIIKNNSQESYTKPETRYPLGAINPDLYLLKKTEQSLYLKLSTTAKVSDFFIGRNAAKDTVQVYINDIPDNSATFNPDTGSVTTKKTINSTDKIYIIWEEENTALNNGSLAAGAGFFYKITPQLTFDSSLTAKWPFTPEKSYADSQNPLYGFAAWNTGLIYKKNNFTLKEQIAFYLENQNASGTFLADSIVTPAENTFYLGNSSGFKVKTVPLITGLTLSEKNDGSKNVIQTTTDAEISGYAVPLEWNFEAIGNVETAWAAVDIKLEGGNFLKDSDSFAIALKNNNQEKINLSAVYLQLGNKAEETFSGENGKEIPVWKISDKNSENILIPFDLNKDGWQTVKIKLTDYQRAKLTQNYDLRLVAVQEKNNKDENSSGCILIGPYQADVQPCFVTAPQNLNIICNSQKTESPSASEFIKSDNFSAKICWNSTFSFSLIQNEFLQDEYKITAANYFEPASFNSYGTINFDFMFIQDSFIKIQNSNQEIEKEALTIILDTDAQCLSEDGTKALELQINAKTLDSFITQKENWLTICIDTDKNSAAINGIELNQDDYSLYLNKNVSPSRRKIIFNTIQKDRIITKGQLYINNLYYKQANPAAGIKNRLYAELKKDGTILKIKDYDLFKNAEISLLSEQNISTSAFNTQNNMADVSALEQSSITAAGIILKQDITANYDFNTQNNRIISSAGHSFSTEKALFNFLSFSENYRYNPDSNNPSAAKSNTIEVNFPYTKINFLANTKNNNSYSQQDISTDFKINLPEKFLGFDFNTKIYANQKIKNDSIQVFSKDYFELWWNSTEFQFSKGDKNAYRRNSNLDAEAAIKLPFAKLGPKIQYKLKASYFNDNFYINTTTVSKKMMDEAEFIFIIPFKIKENSFTLTYNKKLQGINYITTLPENYFDDIQNFLQFQKNKDWFYKTIPANDFFSTELANNVQTSPDTSAFYSCNYAFLWNRELFNSSADFFIPSSASLDISRNIRSGENTADTYQIKSTVTNSSLNIFGAKSTKKIFKWYNTDEFTSSLTTILSIPKDSPQNTEFQISLYNSALFYIKQKDYVKAGTDFMISTNYDWQARGTLIWNRNVQKLPIEAIAAYFYPDFSKLERICTQKETLNIKISREEGIIDTKVQFMHNDELKILKHYSLNTGTGGTFSITQNKSAGISLEFTLGAKIEF